MPELKPCVELVKIAARMVRGELGFSSYQEDFSRKVPKWLLREFECQQGKMNRMAMEIKDISNKLRTPDPRIAELERALKTLVIAKQEKGTNGKTEKYTELRDLGWKLAEQALNKGA